MPDMIPLPAVMASHIGTDAFPQLPTAEFANRLAVTAHDRAMRGLEGFTIMRGFHHPTDGIRPVEESGLGVTRGAWAAATWNKETIRKWWEETPEAPVLITALNKKNGIYFHFAYDGESITSVSENIVHVRF